MTLMTSPPVCLPRHATKRNPDRLTLGPQVAEVSRLLGKPFMPWQHLVADVAHEIDPVTGELAYDEIVLTVPRQSGKTTLEMAGSVHRCTAGSFYGRQLVVYTAQDRGRARKKFEEEFVPTLETSKAFAPRVKPHWGNGNEHIKFRNRSRYAIEANTDSAGHGGVLDKATLDEAFSRADNRQEVAFGPAMITRRNTQLWIVSTAGWSDYSPYLLNKVTLGRERLEDGRPSKVAYFEWSAPEDADPEDESVWWDCMPALGHTVSVEKVRSELAKAMEDTDGEGLAGFRRSYLNQWVPKGGDPAADTVIDMAAWSELVDDEGERPSPVALGIATSPDRKWTTIALAGVRSDDGRHLQVVQSGRGTDWVAARLTELVESWKPVGVAVPTDDPAGSLIPELDAVRRIRLAKLSQRDMAQGCGLVVDGVESGTLHHGNQPLLNRSAGAARRKRTGETWVWAPPADGSLDVSPLKAATAALFTLAKKKPARKKSTSGRRAIIL